MNSFKIFTKASCIAIFIGLGTTIPAHANKVKHNSVSSPTQTTRIDVYSSTGESWDRVDKNKTFEISLPGSFSCNFGNDRKDKYYQFSFNFEGLSRIAGSQTPKPYDPKKQISGHFRYSNATDNFDPIEVCQTEFEKRLNNNPKKTKYDILSKTFPVSVKGALSGNFKAVCRPTGLGALDEDTKDLALDVEVMCRGSNLAEEKIPQTPTKPKTMSVVELITDAKFFAKEETVIGKCPANIDLVGWMKFSRPGTVKYRYVSHDGKVSPTLIATSDKAGRILTRKWSTLLKKTEKGPQWANVKNASGPNTLKGWHKLEFIEPAHLPALTANYNAVCTKEATIAMPDSSDAPERTLRKRPGRAK